MQISSSKKWKKLLRSRFKSVGHFESIFWEMLDEKIEVDVDPRFKSEISVQTGNCQENNIN